MFIIVVVFVSSECYTNLTNYPISVYILFFIKILLFLSVLSRFHDTLKFDIHTMTFSIVVIAIYQSLVDIDAVYRCKVSTNTLINALTLSCIIYCFIPLLRGK